MSVEVSSRQFVYLINIAGAVVKGFESDPGTSDLDDEQPIHVCIPLGIYRKARMVMSDLEDK